MAALALCIAIFSFWTFIGWSVVSALNWRDDTVRNALLAPVTGAAVMLLPILWCNRLGMPVRFAGPLVTAIGIATAFWLIRKYQSNFPWRAVRPFAAILAVAVLANGYPMLIHGLDWVGYCNEDMANYVLSAHQFLKHGFFEVPNESLLMENREANLHLWFLYAVAGVRPGSELILSWVLSSTGLTGHQIFMPVIIALHLVLICSTGALVLSSNNLRAVAIATCAWLSVSALTTLGTTYQLIAQVFGLSLLAGTATLILRAFQDAPVQQRLRPAILAGILGAATGAVYPEITPFLVLSFGLFHFILIVQRKEQLKTLAKAIALAGFFALIFLNTFIPSTLSFLAVQAGRSLGPRALDQSLFPYYLVPSGLANFWGFLPIARYIQDPYMTLLVAIGGVLLIVCSLAALRQAWRGQPAAAICVIMLALGLQLAVTRSDFGLFKLAMYIQPFLIGSAVQAWIQTAESRVHEG